MAIVARMLLPPLKSVLNQLNIDECSRSNYLLIVPKAPSHFTRPSGVGKIVRRGAPVARPHKPKESIELGEAATPQVIRHIHQRILAGDIDAVPRRVAHYL